MTLKRLLHLRPNLIQSITQDTLRIRGACTAFKPHSLNLACMQVIYFGGRAEVQCKSGAVYIQGYRAAASHAHMPKTSVTEFNADHGVSAHRYQICHPLLPDMFPERTCLPAFVKCSMLQDTPGECEAGSLPVC